MSGRRAMVIGWDGVDAEVVRHLLGARRLPNLAAMLSRGGWSDIAEMPGLGDDGHWATFATGESPGVHGRFHHDQIRPGTYQDVGIVRSYMSHRPFWQEMDENGSRVVVIDVPKSPIAKLSNGFEVTDWMVHGGDEPTPQGSSALAATRWHAKWPTEPSFDCDHPKRSATQSESHYRSIESRRARRTEALCHALSQEKPDLFMAVYAEGHCAGHHFWHELEKVYAMVEALDTDLGQLLSLVDQTQTSVAVFSLLGMTSATNANDVIDATLDLLDARLRAQRRSRLGALHRRRRRRNVNRRADRVAFIAPYDAMSTPVRINVIGRDPSGVVRPGADFLRVRELIAAELSGLRDVDTGAPLVREIVLPEQRYPGEHCEIYADLLVCWDVNDTHRRAHSPSFGLVEPPFLPVRRSGDHRGGGWIVHPGGLPATTEVADLGRHISKLSETSA
jgi:predicted AlkP superfamily phosphohydrolase/phosphomutase